MNQSILIVDDNIDNRELTQILLEGDGLEVHLAEDAESALKTLQTYRPHLILMDIQLPEMDGLELTRRLRQQPAFKDVTIVALSAYAMKEDEENARAAGCDGYITKPINTRTFAGSVRGYLKALRPAPAMPTPAIPPPKESKEAMVKTTQPILLVDDDESYRAVLRHHLKALGYEVLEAEDGAEARRMATQRHLQLVILDIVMPNSEGLETISQLRHDGIRTKILAISGAGKALEYLELAGRLGADAKMEKIAPMAELLRVVQLLTGRPDTAISH